MATQKGDKIFNKKAWEQVSRENKNILSDYVLEMKSKGRAQGTIYQYTADIKMFLCWLINNDIDKSILDLKKREYRSFFLEMTEKGVSAARINRVQCSIRNLLEFVASDDDEYEDYEINAMRAIKGLAKDPVREIHFIENKHVEKMIEKLVDQGKYQRALYLSISYESCGRRNEIAQILKEGFLTNNRTNEVVGKRGKKFKLLYFKRSKELAEKYFEQRGEDDVDSLWTVGEGKDRKAAESATLYTWALSLRKLLQEVSGNFLEINAHTWRHTGLENYSNGTHYVLKELGKKELPIKVLKVLANHDDISTTQGYLMNRDNELLDEAFGL